MPPTVAALSVGALVLAFLITLIEYTEVVVLIYALGVERGAFRYASVGAAVGSGVVAAIAIGAGSALTAVPSDELLAASAIVLFAFGIFLFRSTLRSYRRARAPPSTSSHSSPPVHFAGGFTVGAIETTEAVAVLLPLAAGGQGFAAVAGALAAGASLAIAVALVHERIRRIKTPWLKLGATSLIFAFGAFWAGEALNVPWPLGEVFLIPLFAIALGIVRGAIELGLRGIPATAA